MADKLETLTVLLEAQTKQFDSAMKRLSKMTDTETKKVSKSLETMNAKMSGVANNFAKGFAIGAISAAVGALGAMVSSSIETAAAVGDLSDKLGVTSTKLQELNYGAVQANMDFAEFEKSLLKFSKSLGEARNGSGDLRKTLMANGFSEAEIRAMDYSEALDTVAELVKNAATEQDAMLIITQAFGRGGAPMLEFLRDGKKGLDEFAAAAQKANAIISEESVKSAQKFDDAWAAGKTGAKAAIAEWSIYALGKIFEVNDLLEDTARKWGQEAGFISKFDNSGMVDRSKDDGFASAKSDRVVTKLFNPEQDAAAKKARDEATAAAEKQAEGIKKVIDALTFEQSLIGKSTVQQDVANKLREANVTALSKEGIAIQALVEKNAMLAAANDNAAVTAERLAEQQGAFFASLQSLGEGVFSALDEIILRGGKAKDVILDLTKSLLSASLQGSALGQGPLAGLFGGAGGSGGLLGGLLGMFGGGSGFSGLYAGGGYIPSGKWGIVGENGPERVRGPGTVDPAGSFGGGGSGVNVYDQRSLSAPPIKVVKEPNGSTSLYLRDGINEHFSSGKGDNATRGRTGVTPRRVRRAG